MGVVIVLKKQSQPVQVGSLKSKTHPTYLVQEKDILVEVEPDYLPILGKKIKQFFDEKNAKRREDSLKGIIHIGNINGCIRQSMITEQYHDEIEYTIYDYINFMDGLDSEKIIVKILDHGRNNINENGEYQKDIIFDNFVAHPDYIDNETDFLFELKSTNKIQPFILSDDVMKTYIRQIVYYLVLEGMVNGRILARYNLPYFPEYVGKDVHDDGTADNLYKLVFHKESGQFPFFSTKLTIDHSAPSRERIKKELIETIKPLYLQGDITQIPVLDGKVEGKNWKCNSYCKVREICDRIPDLQTDPEKRYVLLNKHIDDATNKVKFSGRKNQAVDIT